MNELNAKITSGFQNIVTLVTSRLKNFKVISLAEKIAYPLAFLGCTFAFLGLIFIILGI